MTHLRKHFEITSFKALPDKDGKTGRFEAHVAMFGNVDLMGDRIVKGAFAEHLKALREIDDPIPVIWSHDWGNPFAHIGWADPKECEETDKGLRIIGYTDPKPFAEQVYDLMKDRRVKEFSFAYDVVRERKARDGANELLELKIIEVGPTLKGANPETELIGVKSALEQAAAQKNIYQPLPGSDEERASRLHQAVHDWGKDTFPNDSEDDHVWVHVVATYPDRVVAAVEGADEDTLYFEFEFSADDEGNVALGDPVQQEVEVTLRTAAASGEPSGAKAGRTLSAKNQRKIQSAADAVAKAAQELQDVLGTVVAEVEEAEPEEKATAPEDDLSGRIAELDTAPDPQPGPEPKSAGDWKRDVEQKAAELLI